MEALKLQLQEHQNAVASYTQSSGDKLRQLEEELAEKAAQVGHVAPAPVLDVQSVAEEAEADLRRAEAEIAARVACYAAAEATIREKAAAGVHGEAYKKVESELALKFGVKWRERGPGIASGGPVLEHWRGQKFRAGSNRYANRGGKRREWFRINRPWENKGTKDQSSWPASSWADEQDQSSWPSSSWSGQQDQSSWPSSTPGEQDQSSWPASSWADHAEGSSSAAESETLDEESAAEA